MSIMDLKKKAPKGEFLAYINKEEANLLKKHGGSGKLVNGIPSFIGFDAGTIDATDSKGNVTRSANTGLTGGYQGGPLGGSGRSNDGNNNVVNVQKVQAAIKKAIEIKKIKEAEAVGFYANKGVPNYQKVGFFQKGINANNNFQKRNLTNLTKKRFDQSAKNIEQYLDFDDYSLDGVKAAIQRGYRVATTPEGEFANFTGEYDSNKETNPDATNPSLGYNFSDLKEGMETLTSNKGTSIEKTRPNLYGVNSPLPGKYGAILNFGFNKLRPDTQVTAQNELDQTAMYNLLVGDPDITREKLDAIGNRGKTQEQIDGLQGTGGDNNQTYIPYLSEKEVEDERVMKDFDYHLGLGGQKEGANVLRGYAAEGGIMGTRARRAMGGIMGRVNQRQGYFLGKIVKGVKSAVSGVADAAKKVLKSDLGKAALIYGGGAMLGSYGAGKGFFSEGMFNPVNMAKGLLLKGGEGDFTLGNISKLKAGALGLGALTLFGNKAPPNEDNFSDRGGSLIDPLTGQPAKPAQMRSSLNTALANANGDPARIKQIQDAYAFLPPDERLGTYLPYRAYGVKDGGRIGKAEGGLMDLGGMEKDYRAEGGFVPIGEYEKKDDVPARLSVNEFVFTADAVRGAGQGDIDKGAEIMENMMENLENGGTVSEESQGNKGAQQMFETSERLGAVI